MMPPLNIDKEVLLWAGVGFCVLLCGVGLYAAGVSEGARAMKEAQEQERAKIQAQAIAQALAASGVVQTKE